MLQNDRNQFVSSEKSGAKVSPRTYLQILSNQFVDTQHGEHCNFQLHHQIGCKGTWNTHLFSKRSTNANFFT
jgi:hypothetical protein